MKIAAEHISVNCPEAEIYNRLLSLDNKHILELGCGSAEITRNIATSGVNRNITALEVDEIAHANNLQITDLPNVTFALAGAQEIPLDNDSVDVVFMFKSLHHVPIELMEPIVTTGLTRNYMPWSSSALNSTSVMTGHTFWCLFGWIYCRSKKFSGQTSTPRMNCAKSQL
jgi:SAM-dependent methyltransferase